MVDKLKCRVSGLCWGTRMSSLYGFQDELTTVACEVLIAQSDAVDKAYYTHLLAVWYICKGYDDNVQPMLRTL